MSRLNPHCPICKGIGWYEAPYYSDFEPRVELHPCPQCHELEAPTKGELVFMAVCFLTLLVTLLAWGAR